MSGLKKEVALLTTLEANATIVDWRTRHGYPPHRLRLPRGGKAVGAREVLGGHGRAGGRGTCLHHVEMVGLMAGGALGGRAPGMHHLGVVPAVRAAARFGDVLPAGITRLDPKTSAI